MPHIQDAFYREARMAAAMTHPGIVAVFDFGVDPVHGAFIVMEYLVGETLADRLAREATVDPKAACDMMLQCAEALNFMHGMGVIHCEVFSIDIDCLRFSHRPLTATETSHEDAQQR